MNLILIYFIVLLRIMLNKNDLNIFKVLDSGEKVWKVELNQGYFFIDC